MAADLFGWDLIYRSVENNLQRKEDLLVAFTHWFIIKNGFLCIGNGDSVCEMFRIKKCKVMIISNLNF